MILTSKAISRRAVLRGIGATVALPFLDAMVPALYAAGKVAANPTNRLSVVYVPNGVMMPSWTPTALGSAFEFSPILKSLEPFRNQMLVLSGLNSKPPAPKLGEGNGQHARASTRFSALVFEPFRMMSFK